MFVISDITATVCEYLGLSDIYGLACLNHHINQHMTKLLTSENRVRNVQKTHCSFNVQEVILPRLNKTVSTKICLLDHDWYFMSPIRYRGNAFTGTIARRYPATPEHPATYSVFHAQNNMSRCHVEIVFDKISAYVIRKSAHLFDFINLQFIGARAHDCEAIKIMHATYNFDLGNALCNYLRKVIKESDINNTFLHSDTLWNHINSFIAAHDSI